MTAQLLARHYGGWRPSLPDFRDLVADTSEIPILREVDPRGDMTPVYDQGRLGSCTANAVAAAIDYDAIVSGRDPLYLSRLHIYYLERKLGGLPLNQDTGAYGRDGFKATRRYGVFTEAAWPYDDNPNAASGRFDDDPGEKVYDERHKLEHPYRVVRRSIDGFKAVLSNRQTIAFGISVYESFESAEVERSGVVPAPARGEQLLGGHEMLVVGYLESEPNHALVRNSWSTGWGLGGYCLMPWSYLLDRDLSGDFRTIYRPLGK